MGQSPLPSYAAGGYVKSPVPGHLTEPGAPERLLSYSDLGDLLNRVPARQPTRRCPGCGSYDYVLSKARGSYVCKFCRIPATTRSEPKKTPVDLSAETVKQLQQALVTNMAVNLVEKG